jgi:bacterioferritin (cytochrome b1)
MDVPASSAFKDKNIKYSSFCNNVLNKSLLVHGTLDSKHQEKMKEFEKRDKVVAKLQSKLSKLRQDFEVLSNKSPVDYTEEDVLNKASLKTAIEDTQEEIDYLESMADAIDYFDHTIDILVNYYNQDDVHHTEPDVEPESDIMDLFAQTKQSAEKSVLFGKYLKRTNNGEQCRKKVTFRVCQRCNVEKTLHMQEGLLTCTSCGSSELVLVDSDKPNYKDPIVENKPSGYKRMNHFSELLNQFQGKESTDIPNDVFEKIINELNKLRIEDLSTLNNYTLRAILKKLNLNSYYEHIPYIINKLNGIPPPSLTRELEDKLRQMFREVQEPFMQFKPKNRKNFLNNNYVFRKLFELLEQDAFLPYFPFLKSKDKLYEHDQVWRKICSTNGWQFIPSI